MKITMYSTSEHDTSRTHRESLQSFLQWQKPWLAWQLLSWTLVTLTAPSFWIVCILLIIDSHSDHPFFWISLPFIVAITHAIAIIRVNQHHHRHAFSTHKKVMLYYSQHMFICSALYFMTGWSSGFLPDFISPLANTEFTRFPLLTTISWSIFLSFSFGFLSFFHGGCIHAELTFRKKMPLYIDLSPRKNIVQA